MQGKWKKAVLWSSLGGLTVGAMAAVLRNRRTQRSPLLQVRPIPATCARVVVWTERFEVDRHGIPGTAYDAYVLEPTSFKVWRVCELPSVAGGGGGNGLPVYHVTWLRCHDPGVPGEQAAEQLLDRFYAVPTVRDREGNVRGRNRLARGGILELAKCLVGGAANGIETGEIHRAAAPLLNFRFEAKGVAGNSPAPQPAEILKTAAP